MRRILRAKTVHGPDGGDEKCAAHGILWHLLAVLHKILPAWRTNVAITMPLREGRREHALAHRRSRRCQDDSDAGAGNHRWRPSLAALL